MIPEDDFQIPDAFWAKCFLPYDSWPTISSYDSLFQSPHSTFNNQPNSNAISTLMTITTIHPSRIIVWMLTIIHLLPSTTENILIPKASRLIESKFIIPSFPVASSSFFLNPYTTSALTFFSVKGSWPYPARCLPADKFLQMWHG